MHNSSKKLGINHGGIVTLYINTLKFDIVFMKVSFFQQRRTYAKCNELSKKR